MKRKYEWQNALNKCKKQKHHSLFACLLARLFSKETKLIYRRKKKRGNCQTNKENEMQLEQLDKASPTTLHVQFGTKRNQPITETPAAEYDQLQVLYG